MYVTLECEFENFRWKISGNLFLSFQKFVKEFFSLYTFNSNHMFASSALQSDAVKQTRSRQATLQIVML